MPDTIRSGQRITAAERRAEVVRLRRSRASFDEIGRALGVSRQRAWSIYQKALGEIPAAQLEEHLAEELALVDDAIADLMPLARDHAPSREGDFLIAEGPRLVGQSGADREPDDLCNQAGVSPGNRHATRPSARCRRYSRKRGPRPELRQRPRRRWQPLHRRRRATRAEGEPRQRRVGAK